MVGEVHVANIASRTLQRGVSERRRRRETVGGEAAAEGKGETAGEGGGGGGGWEGRGELCGVVPP